MKDLRDRVKKPRLRTIKRWGEANEGSVKERKIAEKGPCLFEVVNVANFSQCFRCR